MSLLQIKTGQFEGPLDLLLALIDGEKLAITEISLSHVTEQFLLYVETLEESRADSIADFLVVASRLVLLKSKFLLPHFLGEGEEEGESLEAQLRRYKLFVDASRKLNRSWNAVLFTHFRQEPVRVMTEEFSPATNATLPFLKNAMYHIVARLAPIKPLPIIHMDRQVSVKEKIAHIRSFLARVKRATFHELLSDAQNKTERIISFLAILELAKLEHISLRQKGIFQDIFIETV